MAKKDMNGVLPGFNRGGSGVTSSNGKSATHPYLRVEFWMDERNQFWEDPAKMYSEQAKDYYRTWLRKLQKADIRQFTFRPKSNITQS
jgi:hypothetical protein